MGTQPRPRHAAAKAKAHRHGHAAKAKACMLPRPGQPHGHAAKAKECSSQGEGTSSWARCQGQGMNAAKARVAPMGTVGKEARFGCDGGGAELIASELVVVELVEGSNFLKVEERLLCVVVVVVVRLVESESGFLFLFLTLRIP